MENLLIGENGLVKIIDFGFAACVPSYEKLKIFCGTPSYMAPEIVNRQEYFGPPADMWSIGILMYVLLCGTYPFKAESDRDLYKKIARGSYGFPDTLSESARALITKLLQVDPKKRPTSEEVINDRFFIDRYTSSSGEKADELYRRYGKVAIEKIVLFFGEVIFIFSNINSKLIIIIIGKLRLPNRRYSTRHNKSR